MTLYMNPCNKLLSIMYMYLLWDVPTATRNGRSQLVLSSHTVTLIYSIYWEGIPVPNVTYTCPDNTLITPGGCFNMSIDGRTDYNN